MARHRLSSLVLPCRLSTFAALRRKPVPVICAHGFATRVAPSEDSRSLYSYTSGCYLYNEKARLAERNVELKIQALKVIAVTSVGRGNVNRIKKLVEGGLNRVFLLALNDGFQVIAKIPYHSTVPKTLTTESAVATLAFLHRKVSTGYILMEKAPGRPLASRWFELAPKERVLLVTSFVEIEPKLFSIPFGSYGSLYYRYSLSSRLRGSNPSFKVLNADVDDANRFCIGPSADSMFWRGRCAELKLDRGPWTGHRDNIRAVGQRELEWAFMFGKPQQNKFPHNSILEGEISHIKYIDLLRKYISLASYILPEHHDNPLNRPTIRHPGLKPSNVPITDSCDVSLHHRLATLDDPTAIARSRNHYLKTPIRNRQRISRNRPCLTTMPLQTPKSNPKLTICTADGCYFGDTWSSTVKTTNLISRPCDTRSYRSANTRWIDLAGNGAETQFP
ncbi:hypothetical protein BDW62DRAFT_202719 [Aspergillus aurantiobrunneus]